MSEEIKLYLKNKVADTPSMSLSIEEPIEQTSDLVTSKVVACDFENQTVEVKCKFRPKILKELRAAAFGFTRPSCICRKRKRQIERAHWMMVQHDHTCYEWSQWWPKPARKPKRWKHD